MLKIKLSPRGKKHQITYRILVAPDKSKLNGKFIDDLGFYNPHTNQIKIDKHKLANWLKNGAKLTDGVGRLLEPDKYPPKKKKDRSKKEEAPVKPTEVKSEETVKTEPGADSPEPQPEKVSSPKPKTESSDETKPSTEPPIK